ncbi:hypothetical protein CTL2C_536 [Chlamydia trachomatis L2c]|nr:hypothetical protein CTL2C_536 [Chlamydia trachomatis L2c]
MHYSLCITGLFSRKMFRDLTFLKFFFCAKNETTMLHQKSFQDYSKTCSFSLYYFFYLTHLTLRLSIHNMPHPHPYSLSLHSKCIVF